MYDISIDRLSKRYGNIYELVIACAVRARDIYNQDTQSPVEEGEEQLLVKTTTRALRNLETEVDVSGD
jgi:DNA-directed RNA polymerase omega subunit